MKETNPKVGSQVKFIKSWVRCVFIWKGLVVKLGELHSFEESLLWHELHLSGDIWNGGLEFVVNNNDFVSILGHLRNMDSHGHNSWVVVRSSNVWNRKLKQIWEWSGQTTFTLFTNGENLGFGSCDISLFHHFLDISNNRRVNSTAKSLIRGDWYDNNRAILWFSRHFSLHKLITLEDHIDSFVSEILTSM